MAETKKPEPKKPPPRPGAPAAAAGPSDPGAQLEELNDQLARFLQHADQLVDEWARFGADVRRTVDVEVGRIDQAVVDAVERAAREVDRGAAERIERAIEHGVSRLRGELERSPRPAGGGTSAATASAAAAAPPRALLAAVVIADVLLLVLLVLALRGGGAAAPAAAPAGTAVPGPDAVVEPVPAEVRAACTALAAGTWSADAAEEVVRAGTAACGDDEAVVRALLAARLAEPAPPPVDAGPVDGPPPDAKGRRPGR